MNAYISKNVRYNFVVNVMDGGFFGLGLGLTSFVTVLPLFVSTMTDSAVLIGLIPAIHTMGWQLPQLFTGSHVSRLKRYKPMTVLMTIQERLPFLGLAVVAWFLPGMGRTTALALTFGLLIWQGLGGGLTATAWQSMIGKIMPDNQRGFFFGVQSGVANLLASGGAVVAGLLLEKLDAPYSFSACFFMTSLAMAISWFFIASTREAETAPDDLPKNPPPFWSSVKSILRSDSNFRWFVIGRALLPLGTLAFGFYTVYAVQRYEARPAVTGLLTAVLMTAQVIANLLMGWLSDRWSQRAVIEIGALAAVASALLAAIAPSIEWFYLIFILAGIANVAYWTISIAMTLEFGTLAERPAYISLSNTLVAPGTILAPLLGGWLADIAGYPATFWLSAIGGLVVAAVFHLAVRDPRRVAQCPPEQELVRLGVNQ